MRWSELPPAIRLPLSTWVLSLFLLALPTAVLGLLAARTGVQSIAVGRAWRDSSS